MQDRLDVLLDGSTPSSCRGAVRHLGASPTIIETGHDKRRGETAREVYRTVIYQIICFVAVWIGGQMDSFSPYVHASCRQGVPTGMWLYGVKFIQVVNKNRFIIAIIQ